MICNKDLWEALYELRQKHRLKYKKVKAHSGHTENERCDALAKRQSEIFNECFGGYLESYIAY